jgi:hypothetical protein
MEKVNMEKALKLIHDSNQSERKKRDSIKTSLNEEWGKQTSELAKKALV